MDHIPEGVRYFLGKRLAEACGLMLLAFAGALALAFLTWSVQDPSFNHATSGPVRNLLGGPGAMVADLTMQMVGIAATAVIVPIGFWGLRLMNHRRLERLGLRMVLWMVGVGSAVLYKVVDLIVGLRVPIDAEREGLDVAEHGERAYNM